jgi:hypothetical protein
MIKVMHHKKLMPWTDGRIYLTLSSKLGISVQDLLRIADRKEPRELGLASSGLLVT